MTTKPTHTTTYTENELLYLSDTFTAFTPWPENFNDFDTFNLIRKIGFGLIYIKEKPSTTAPITLSLEELWTIRDYCKSYAMMGNEKVGLNLLYKMYRAINQLEDESGQVESQDSDIVNVEDLPNWLDDVNLGEE